MKKHVYRMCNAEAGSQDGCEKVQETVNKGMVLKNGKKKLHMLRIAGTGNGDS